ncbi:MAG TPA: hypothetical protein VMR21_08490 [Vicinamibacteria bacterium]|nr:hypothetical protein [Vicinamibacteria bacterium]
MATLSQPGAALSRTDRGPGARPDRWADFALSLGVAAAIAFALAFRDSRFHVVPTSDGGTWRGVSDPPDAGRVAFAIVVALATALAIRNTPRRWRTPLLGLGLTAAPLAAVYTGAGSALLAVQGPVSSFVVGASVAVALARRMATGPPGPAPAVLLFAAPMVFFAALAGRIPGAAGPQGDEPHYLAMAHSLWTDGDLDLTDEFAAAEYAAFFPGRLDPHPSPSTPHGRLYSLHSPGLAWLILPGYAAAGHRGAQLVLCALAALSGVLVHRATRAALGDGAAAVAWALYAFTPPIAIYAVNLYPELPAALVTATFLVVARGTPGWRGALAAAVAAGAAPWLHSKFLPLGAVGLLLTLLRPCRWRIRAAAVAVYAAMVVALLLYFRATYGVASFSAAFGPPDIDLGRLPWGVGALLVDRQFGLFTFSPVWLLALPGAAVLLRWGTGDALRALLLASVPLVVGGAFTTWWGGSSPPARFLVPAVPALALLAAPAARARKDVAAALGAVGLVLVGLASEAPRILHNRPDGQSLLLRNLAPAVDLGAFLPSFFEKDVATAVLALTLVAAFAVGWRYGLRGTVAGVLAYALVAGALRDRPVVDQRVATELVIDKWDPHTWGGPMGPPPLRALAIPLELQRGPWVLGPGELRNSRRTGLPPGSYRIELRASAAEPGPFRLGVDVYAAELPLGQAVLTADQPWVAFPLFLPAGARQLGLTAVGQKGRAVLDEARVVPEALIPRHHRGDFPPPVFAREDRYRRGGPRVRFTAVDRSEPEGEGFRLAGRAGHFLVDGPAPLSVVVEVRRAVTHAGDEVRWAGRMVPLPPTPNVELVLPMADGAALGRETVVPVEVRAEGAWVRFREATGAP